MRVMFMGTALFACPTLQGLVASSHQVVAVVTQPDRPRGRGQHSAASAVKLVALEQHLPIFQPASLRPPAVLDTLAAYQPEVIVVVAYGNILPVSVLELPLQGCINLHASLLPKYRGAAPINWSLIQGETVTGYTVIQMDAHVDTGPILWQEVLPIAPEDDAVSLGRRLGEAGAHGVLHVLQALGCGSLTPAPQSDAGASYAPKLTRDVGRLDWSQPAVVLHNLIRGLVPWPGAITMWQGRELKIWRAQVMGHGSAAGPGTITAVLPEGICVACGVQQLMLQEVQPANRRRMLSREFVQGYHVQLGDQFDYCSATATSPPNSPTHSAHA